MTVHGGALCLRRKHVPRAIVVTEEEDGQQAGRAQRFDTHEPLM
jgi:hypothetical protein